MERTTFNEYLENRIYKEFEKLKATDNIKIAELLENIDFQIHLEKKELKFSHTSLFKAMLFMKLKKMSQSMLVRHLKKNEKDSISLGFYFNESNELLVPDQRTISYFYNNVIDDDLRKLLDNLENDIRESVEKFDMITDLEEVKTEEPKKLSKSSDDKKKAKHLNEISKLMKKHVYSSIEIKMNHNSIYRKNYLLNLMTELSKRKCFAESGLKMHLIEKNEKTPSADTLLYHLKKFDADEIQKIFIKSFEKSWKLAKKHGILNKRKYDVAIDYTDWLYFGKPTEMVVRGKEREGTNKSFRFATISIVENGCRFVLLALPVNTFSNRKNVIDKLLAYAKSKIRINRLYADRGFFSQEMINLFKDHGLKFLMPATQNSRIKKMLKTLPAPSVINEYEMTQGKVNYNLVIIEDEKGEKRAFATNLEVSEKEANLSIRLFGLYSKRWGIETSYRVLKDLRAKTTSKNYKIRLFYFLFSIMLYNMWILVDAVLMWCLKGKIISKHLVEAKIFLSKFLNIPDKIT